MQLQTHGYPQGWQSPQSLPVYRDRWDSWGQLRHRLDQTLMRHQQRSIDTRIDAVSDGSRPENIRRNSDRHDPAAPRVSDIANARRSQTAHPQQQSAIVQNDGVQRNAGNITEDQSKESPLFEQTTSTVRSGSVPEDASSTAPTSGSSSSNASSITLVELTEDGIYGTEDEIFPIIEGVDTGEGQECLEEDLRGHVV